MSFDNSTLMTMSFSSLAALVLGVFVRWWKRHRPSVRSKPGKFE